MEYWKYLKSQPIFFSSTSIRSTLSPPSKPTPKLQSAWRQGSDNWSSTGSRQSSSRPGSSLTGAGTGSRPPSQTNILYCKSDNSSTSDVSVARQGEDVRVVRNIFNLVEMLKDLRQNLPNHTILII